MCDLNTQLLEAAKHSLVEGRRRMPGSRAWLNSVDFSLEASSWFLAHRGDSTKMETTWLITLETREKLRYILFFVKQ